MRDPWVIRRWHVFKGQPKGGIFLGPGSFRLEAVCDQVSRQTAYYRVVDIKDMEYPFWEGVLLFPRGDLDSDKPSTMLPPWDEDCDPKWEAAAKEIREKYKLPGGIYPGIDPRIRRLEGDMCPQASAGKAIAEAVTLVRVPSAVKNAKTGDKSDLLVLILKSRDQPNMDPLEEDGTAHGGNPH